MSEGKGSIFSTIGSFIFLVTQMTVWGAVLGYKKVREKFPSKKQRRPGPITRAVLFIYKLLS